MSPRQAGYQPEWKDGKEHGTGWRDAAGRYEAIKRHLVTRMARTDVKQFDKPTVLDIGAYNGYFCRRLADDFQARCLAVDGQPFLEPYRSPSGGYVDVDRALWTPQDIREREAGGVDIILCLSVLHHHENWLDFLKAMIARGTCLFIETANPQENLSEIARTNARAAWSWLYANDAEVIVRTPPMNDQPDLRPLWVLDQGAHKPLDVGPRVSITNSSGETLGGFLTPPGWKIVLHDEEHQQRYGEFGIYRDDELTEIAEKETNG